MSTPPERKVTPKMKKLYDELLAEVDGETQNVSIECQPSEWRTAKALEQIGLLEICGGRGESGHFEVLLPRTPVMDPEKPGCPDCARKDAEIKLLVAALKAAREVSRAQDGLLMCYRTVSHRGIDKVLDRLAEARLRAVESEALLAELKP